MKIKPKENKNGKKTRSRLLNAAGSVFAQKGYEAASVRDIADAAGVPFALITFHFKTKKNLFRQTIEHFILNNAKLETLFYPFKDADPACPESISAAMYESVKNIVYICHKPKARIKQINGLMMTLLKDGGKEANKMVQLLGDNTMADVYRLLYEANPRLTRTDIYWWSHMFWCRVAFLCCRGCRIYGNLPALAAAHNERSP